MLSGTLSRRRLATSSVASGADKIESTEHLIAPPGHIFKSCSVVQLRTVTSIVAVVPAKAIAESTRMIDKTLGIVCESGEMCNCMLAVKSGTNTSYTHYVPHS